MTDVNDADRYTEGTRCESVHPGISSRFAGRPARCIRQGADGSVCGAKTPRQIRSEANRLAWREARSAEHAERLRESTRRTRKRLVSAVRRGLSFDDQQMLREYGGGTIIGGLRRVLDEYGDRMARIAKYERARREDESQELVV